MTSAAVKVRGARVVALRATGLQVDGDVLCEVDDGQPFTAMGEVRLRRAHVRGQLSLSGARLIVPDQERTVCRRTAGRPHDVLQRGGGKRLTASGEVLGEEVTSSGLAVVEYVD